MENRCDIVDAVMYAYCEMMRIKEENQMLEKDKDYVEFTLQCTTVERTSDKDYREVCFNGYSDYDFPGVPMDIVCKEFGHKVVVVGKRKFEELQTENEQLKKKLEELSPVSGYKFLTALYSEEDIEKLVWATKHICGRDLRHTLQVDLEYYKALSSAQAKSNETLSKLVGFSSVEEIQDYLTNEAKCDTLHEAIHLMCEEMDRRQKKIDELRDDISGRSTVIEYCKREIEKWKKETGYGTPEEAKKRIDGILEDLSKADDENKKLQDRLKTNKYNKLWITANGMLFSESDKTVDVLEAQIEEASKVISDWQKATGCNTPEEAKEWVANIGEANGTLANAILSWQEITGCKTPDDAKKKIKALQDEDEEWAAEYNHLLLLTGFGTDEEIEEALDRCDRSSLRKALVDYEFDHITLLSLTGYNSEHDIRVLLRSEESQYRTMRDLINSLKRKGKFTESNWQKATGCDTPTEAETTMRNLRGRIDEIKGFAAIASNWTDRIVED